MAAGGEEWKLPIVSSLFAAVLAQVAGEGALRGWRTRLTIK
jgi:hypothetical protein